MKLQTDQGNEVIVIVSRRSCAGVDQPIIATSDQRIIRALMRELSRILGVRLTYLLTPKHP